MSSVVYFFGCGTHRNARMMSYILGRPETELRGETAVLKGYRLAVQNIDDVPDLPRSYLEKNWDKNFQNYILTQDEQGQVSGTVWQITHEDLELIRYWELVDYGWYQEIDVVVNLSSGKLRTAKTVCLRRGHTFDRLVTTTNYKVWLQDPRRYQEIAKKSREAFYHERKKS